ncbi:MAG: biosynthetic-type acetolactate synthase large subunit [Clostridiaceae bacterium]|nr:biosynthetic-type acetolactate synthase large subunit [Clostridiaceae bacterium]
MRMTGAEAIVKALEMEKTDVIFGYPGAAISPFYDALLGSSITHILTRHEQGAAHGANGYARVTGRVGVCVATSGPGATNLITGIANAYMDSIPIIAITGQVPCAMIGTDAFQEADITGATAPFSKHNYLVKDAEDLPKTIKEAFHIAATGRPGPVVIDVPVDVQNSTLDFKYPKDVDIKGYKPTCKGHPMQIKKAVAALEAAQRPVICAGGGVIAANASEELLELAQRRNIPVATTLMGIGSIPSNHPLNCGMIGTHGKRTANYALNHADLVLILGARVGDRAIGSASVLAKRAKIIHIDVDPAEIGKNINTAIPLVGDVKLILADMLKCVSSDDSDQWAATIAEEKQKWQKKASADANELKDDKEESQYVNPKYLLPLLSEVLPAEAIIATEVGQNQIWAANNCQIHKPKTFITSGGLGTMGYGLPAAIGAKIGRPEVPVAVISGDGSFQMSVQELGTMKHYAIGVKIVLFNNSRLGMVRELQLSKHEGRYSQVCLDKNPDFVALAAAYGFKGERISSNSQVKDALKRLTADDEPYLLECIVDPMEPTL